MATPKKRSGKPSRRGAKQVKVGFKKVVKKAVPDLLSATLPNLTQCPNCGAIWDIEEITTQSCLSCDYDGADQVDLDAEESESDEPEEMS